jgi:hypothetical protein
VICARCDGPIRRNEPSRRINRQAGTGAGAVEYVHVRACEPPSPQASRVWQLVRALI